MLTQKQKDLLVFIHERMQTGDIAPSFEEMKNALGLKSKSGIHRLISALVERGYLERLPHRARALEVTRMPEGYVEVSDNVEEAKTSTPANNNSYSDSTNIVPLYGRIAAGTPIEAIRDESGQVEIPLSMMSRNGEHYALEVDGDSMINAGIHNHDIVIIRKAETAENGMIVVALVDGEEVTLKRFRRSGNKIILEPENDEYEPQVLDPERVKIQGHLVSLMRTYH